MAAQLSCSFSSHSNSTCDFSARFPGKNEFFPLSSCTRDIKSHLRQLKVTQTSVRSEKDLILARVGFFDEMGDDMTVCPKHCAALGTWWRLSLKCLILSLILCMAISDENQKEEQAYRRVKRL